LLQLIEQLLPRDSRGLSEGSQQGGGRSIRQLRKLHIVPGWDGPAFMKRLHTLYRVVERSPKFAAFSSSNMDGGVMVRLVSKLSLQGCLLLTNPLQPGGIILARFDDSAHCIEGHLTHLAAQIGVKQAWRNIHGLDSTAAGS